MKRNSKNIFKKILIVFASIIGILVIAYFLGPKQTFEKVNSEMSIVPVDLQTLDAVLNADNEAFDNMKDKCEKAVHWHNDSIHQTEYAVVFLHGFSACAFEGNPIVNDFAKEFGCNLYLHRFPQHGLTDDESFKTITPEIWVESAKEALNIGKSLGKKVILMSSSTGGTLSTYLTANHPDLVAAQFLYSPNIALASPASVLLNNPWGLQLIRSLSGNSDYHNITDMSAEAMPFWTTTYRIEGIVALQDLIEQTMTDETFDNITSPVFIGYYYKNEEEKDNVVSIDAMKHLYETIKTPESDKRIVSFSEVGGHVITNQFQKGGLDDVREATFKYAREVVFK